MPKYWTKKDMDFSYLSPKVSEALELVAGVILINTMRMNDEEGREFIAALLRLINTMKRIEDQVSKGEAVQ